MDKSSIIAKTKGQATKESSVRSSYFRVAIYPTEF